jgi:Methylase involved in ubiquinone/menaquinone biosynthesis
MSFDDPQGYAQWYKIHSVTYENELAVVGALGLHDCLDVGSGPSVFHEVIEGEVVSLDLSEITLLYAREGEERVQADALHMPFRDEAFPCVFSSVTFCFIKDLDTLMKEIHRVTRQTFAGCIVVLDSEWGRHYSELAGRGHKYYSKARFLNREEFFGLVKRYFRIDKIVSTLSYGPDQREVREAPREDWQGAFLCLKGTKLRWTPGHGEP